MPSSQLPPVGWGGWQPWPEKLKKRESEGWQSVTSHATAARMLACTCRHTPAVNSSAAFIALQSDSL